MRLKRPVRIAVQLQPIHADYPTIRRRVAEVDASGADILFNSDHFFPSVGAPDGPCFEAWTTLGAWAEQTSRVALGVSVSSSTYRNPHLMADMARTVDHVSGGRAILGIGSGWFAPDHDRYGFDFPEMQDRLALFAEALEAISYRMPRLNPRPMQSRLPVMVGNGGDHKPAELIARHADIWLDFKSVEEVAENNRAIDAACEEIQRNPADVERGIALHPNQLSLASDFLSAGCTLVMLRTLGPDFDLKGLPSLLKWRDGLNKSFNWPLPDPIRSFQSIE